KDLAHGNAHDRDGDPVPGLIDAALGIVRPHLTAPGVAGERGELRARDEFQCFEGEARRVAAGIAIPAPGFEATLHLPGAHDDIIAALEFDLLFLGRKVKIVAADAVPTGEAVFAQRAGTVAKYPAADHLA